MKIVDAVWEERNMGISSTEVILESGDTVADLKQLNKISSNYQVVRCPITKTDLMFGLEKHEFKFIEAMIYLHYDLRNPIIELKGPAQRIVESTSCSLMDETDIEELFSQIRAGIFKNDRVSLDLEFTNEQATNRYIGWIKDEITRGAFVYKCFISNENYGFFTLFRDDDNFVHFALNGVYKEYENSGIGLSLFFHMINEAKKIGCKALKGNGIAISTNNINSLKICISMGFCIKNIMYIYIKHS